MKLSKEPIQLAFVKLNGEWYADVPFWHGPINSLQMKGVTKSLLDNLSTNGHFILFQLATEQFPGCDIATLRTKHRIGATYELPYIYETALHQHGDILDFGTGLKQILGECPEKIYFAQVHDEFTNKLIAKIVELESKQSK